jgi:serine/threonine protein kinase
MSGPQLIANRFELGHLIGEGGVGRVYRGLDTETDKPVAIKVLRGDVIAEAPELIVRFEREGQVLRQLNHPNIISVLATLKEGGRHYIVMEYIGGGSLADLLGSQPQLPVERVLAIALEVADALTRAHHLHIIHRDIKPGNILLAEDGTPRLTDFGLAHVGNYPPVTAVGSVIGTFQYLSPEACSRQPLDERADIWSFGVVMYEMLAGRRPFDGAYPTEIMRAILHQSVPPLTHSRRDIPPALGDLIRRMMARNTMARIASMRQVGAELEEIMRGTDTPTWEAQASGADAPQFVTPPSYISAGPPSSPPVQPQPLDAQREVVEVMQPSHRVSVLIVDDHPIVRRELRAFLELQDDIKVAGEGADGVEAVEQAQRLQPDVVLLDLVMPNLDGIEATRRILECSPQSRVLILTSFGEDDKVFPAIRAGAHGYLLKDISPDDLVEAIREAYAGKAQLHPEVTNRLMAEFAAREESEENPNPEGRSSK